MLGLWDASMLAAPDVPANPLITCLRGLAVLMQVPAPACYLVRNAIPHADRCVVPFHDALLFLTSLSACVFTVKSSG